MFHYDFDLTSAKKIQNEFQFISNVYPLGNSGMSASHNERRKGGSGEKGSGENGKPGKKRHP